MREAVIVSTARTPIGKAYRGGFKDTQGQELAGHAISHAVRRAGIDGGEVEDVILGCAMQQGSTGVIVARQGLLRAGLPDAVPGMTIDRQCSSGLMAIAAAARQIVSDGMQFALLSQSRTAAAQAEGRFDAEIVALGQLARDEGNRPSTTLEALAALRPVLPDGAESGRCSRCPSY
jgi:acetyl-CoA acetyltransferase